MSGTRKLRKKLSASRNRKLRRTRIAKAHPVSTPSIEGGPAAPQAGKKGSHVVRSLEAQLRAPRKEHEQLVERLENENEKLETANENLASINQQLLSANNELTASKEEMESLSEELISLNEQLDDKVPELSAVNDDLANLLVSTDIATVFVDIHFRIKLFTTAAARPLNLLPSDIGRPINQMSTNLVDMDLFMDVRAVLGDQKPLAKEVAATDGKQYFVRVVPYRSSNGQVVQGVVLTFVDVTALKLTERELRTAQGQLQRLNQTLERRVTERTKWLTLMHEVTRAISEAPTWDDALHRVLCGICETEQWQIGFVYLPDKDSPDTIVPVISCFEQERFRPFHLASEQQRYVRGESLPGRVYAEGIPQWVNNQDELVQLVTKRSEAVRQIGLKAAAALPVTVGREVIAVLELFSIQSHAPSEELVTLMNDVSAQIGRVLERERWTAEMADLVSREQQDLLHTLHDSLGQTLAGLGMLSAALSKRLARGDVAAAVETAEQVAQQAQQALEQVRQLSTGRFSLGVAAEGLVPALHQLASATESVHEIHVEVEGDVQITLRDARVATELYRIAQEAVTNAVKHAHARTIRIQVSAEPGLTSLRIIDDGVGIRKEPAHDGLGLRIMQYRATSIGASLSIDPGASGGTIVTLTLREAPRPETSNMAGARGIPSALKLQKER